MCEAFTLAKLKRPLTDIETAVTEAVTWGADKMFRPNSTAPVLLPDGQLHHLTWGIRRSFLPCVHLIKCSSLGDKSWKSAASRGRCVIPMTTFLEMKRDDGCGPVFELAAKDGGLIWVAGIWDVVQRKPRRFAIITREHSTEAGSHTHPVAMDEEGAWAYLSKKVDAASTGDFPFHRDELPGALCSRVGE